MFRILTGTAFVVCMTFSVGCKTTPYDGTGRCSPEFKVHNAKRIVKEAGWFYADVQDVVFGVDYHLDMEREFGQSPYK